MQKFQLLAEYESRSLAETKKIGQLIYSALVWPSCVYLKGDLGAGKTTLCQSIIQAAGYQSIVTSPTYNLIQEYPVTSDPSSPSAAKAVKDGSDKRVIYHMDLYRLNDPQELYYLGVTDLWDESSLFLVEWPEKGDGVMQQADYVVEITKTMSNINGARKILLYQNV